MVWLQLLQKPTSALYSSAYNLATLILITHIVGLTELIFRMIDVERLLKSSYVASAFSEDIDTHTTKFK